MDCKDPQEAYLPETGYCYDPRAGAVDALPLCRKGVECKRGASARIECHIVDNPTCTDTCGADHCKAVQVCQKGDDIANCTTGRPEAGRWASAVSGSTDVFGRSELEIRFKSLLAILRRVGWKFSRNESVTLLGGEKRLETLLNQGKIHATKKNGAANTKWEFDAAEVIMYVKPNKMYLV